MDVFYVNSDNSFSTVRKETIFG